jgi:TDG/mug DNA glycosylase family protein
MDSPASKAFADRLAKYAFDPSSSSRARTRSTRAAAGPGPATALARNSSPVSGPSAVKRKRRNRADDEEFVAQDEDEYISSPSRTPARRSASSTPGRTTPKSGKKPRPFAGPEVYAHLKPVTDHLKPDLDSE